MKGKLIVIEGTDCSGKETQTKMLMEKLSSEGMPTIRYSFPDYDSPTGKIVGGPYLGKDYICEGWFPELAPNVDPKVSSLYYAADRKYNLPKILANLENGTNVILDRYVFSNMAHQGGKLFDKDDRFAMYDWLHTLEFELLGLPLPDVSIFLHMPYDAACILKSTRQEKADQHEADKEHLINAELAYVEIANKYGFKVIECTTKMGDIEREDIKTPSDINDEVYSFIKKELANASFTKKKK